VSIECLALRSRPRGIWREDLDVEEMQARVATPGQARGTVVRALQKLITGRLSDRTRHITFRIWATYLRGQGVSRRADSLFIDTTRCMLWANSKFRSSAGREMKMGRGGY
jgi:hypothetical protein